MKIKSKIEGILVGIKQVYKKKSILFIVYSALKIILFYLLHKRSRAKKTFTFNKNTYNYFIHYYNLTWENERTIEIPIARKIMNEFEGKTILEVGNVTPNYFAFRHDILDKYEKAKDVINEDVCDFQTSKKYNLIISISTMEHVGWDENPREPGKILRAIKNLKTLLAPQGKLIVTLPLGYNSDLDKLLNNGKIQFTKTFFLKRISKDNQWMEVGWDDIRGAKYNHPFLMANGLIVGAIEK